MKRGDGMIKIPNNIRLILENEGVKKNFRVTFLNLNHSDLTNENIYTDTVSLSESICSKGIQFGTCDASSLMFEADLDMNIKGYDIEARLEIDISGESEAFIEEHGHTSLDLPYPFYIIPYGQFRVKNCKKSNKGSYQIEAYTVLLGDNADGSDGSTFREEDLPAYTRLKMRLPVDNVPYKFSLQEFVCENTYSILEGDWDEQELHPWTVDGRNGINVEYNIWFRSFNSAGGVDTFNIEMTVGYTGFTNVIGPDSFKPEWRYTLYEYQLMNPERVDLKSIAKDVEEAFYDTFSYREWWQESSWDTIEQALRYAWRTYCSIDIQSSTSMEPMLKTSELDSSNHIVLSEEFNTASSTYKNMCTTFTGFPTYLSFRMTDEDNNVTFYKKIDIPEAEIKGRVLWLTDYNNEKIYVEFPRTLSYKAGKRKYYNLDYEALFSDGYTVAKKDKSGNVVKTTYKCSLRDLVEAFSELNATFGVYSRADHSFHEKPLNIPEGFKANSTLVPTDSGPNIIPTGAVYKIAKRNIKSVEWDENLTKAYDRIICTCSPTDEDTSVKLIIELDNDEDVRSMSNDGSITYDLSKNYYIKSFPMTTMEIRRQMRKIIEALKGFRFMECSIQSNGFPFLEVGDLIEFETEDGTMRTIIMRQTISGVNTLTTTIESGV